MTIKLSPPEQKRNYWEAGFHGLLAVLEAINPTGPNVPNVLTNIKAGFGAIAGKPEDSPENRAWVWAFKTLSYATSDLLKTEQLKAPLSENHDAAVKEFLDAATQFNGKELDGLAILNPGLSPIFDNAHNALGSMILKATTGHNLGLSTLSERFKQALRTGSNRTLCEDPTYFRILEDALTGLAGEGARRDGHWARHAHWISHQFTDAPIFSPNEEDIIPLEAVYLPLRCFWHENHKIIKEDGTETQSTTAHVANLHHTTHTWLSKDAKYNPLLVVTGGPGSGKSSYARAFAHEVIQAGGHRVLFIQLQHMTLTGSLDEDIARYIDRRDTSTGKYGSPGLPGNPLNWRKTDQTPLLMIFDGLDELSTKEEDGERYARELLLALKVMLSPLNSDGTPIRALVLGRNLACQSAMSAASIDIKNMLNVAPIAKMDKGTCMMSFYHDDKDIKDPGDLMKHDQRFEYWRNWAYLKGLDAHKIPEAITAESMKELNAEPLLLHLLIISKYCGEDWEIAVDNKNFVYEDILQKIFERNKEKDHFRSAGITEDLFFELMECLGISAWRGNGRTGGEDDFRLIRKLHLNKEKKFKSFPAANLKSVALNIHTRAGQDDMSSGFEFIHKSFGEYLAARGLLFHALKTAQSLHEKEPEDVEQSWSQIIGGAELTNEIVHFLYNEARRVLSPKKSLEPKSALTDFINWVIINGFSVHKTNPDLAWSELVIKHRCAVSALIASTSAIATAIPIGDWSSNEFDAPWTINIRWPKDDLVVVKRIVSDIGITVESPIISALRRINLSDQRLWDTSLSRTNFEGADLRSATLTWNLCIGTNFENANLRGIDAPSARLIDSNLMNCDLSKSDLSYAYFEGVDMRNCNLTLSSLRNIDASSRTGLGYSSVNEVSGSINFFGAILTGADLSDADLSGAINLSLEAINSATGTIGTRLPKYIDRREVIWLQGDNAKHTLPEQHTTSRLRHIRHAARLKRKKQRNN